MAVVRLSVTVPSEVGAALRALADARGQTVSTIVAEAIAHRIRLAALDQALEDADRRFGPLGEDQVAEAEEELVRFAKRRSKRARKRSAA